MLEKVAAVLKKNPCFRCCSLLARTAGEHEIYHIKNMLVNPSFSEDAQEVTIAVSETKEIKHLGNDILVDTSVPQCINIQI